ncbi:MAG: secondary thiamine-phosphate synthase enzyme YjbQ [Deltaproteobacteria bacterium]|jgi:secondary thiamine-phosphate synthase enzyme|nr:secondary thiamine-phosphate synthase enzyme YjbQ [Deltaproteobacteria bacterium]
MYSFTIKTPKEGFINITSEIKNCLLDSNILEGFCVVFVPHTTAGVTINENADPNVPKDILLGLARAFPDSPDFQHNEGNSAAHLKSSAVGSSVTILVEKGELVLGTWQGVFFCEFDGPRNRIFYVKFH